ncbi:hypothetical protein [Micromonospora andamanensis]|uniref:hypothetical protein n=1 Tax=Micromonospora andamanensis TaxID=1287068 RepID=UPI00195254E1|nr:hypothetical protein [Micromonospora andamanensis]
MTIPRPGPDPDDPWRRPDSGEGSPSGPPAERTPAPADASQPSSPDSSVPVAASDVAGSSGGGGGYSGPPPTTAPPPGWRPPVHLQPAPPRQLPGQDMIALDAQEQRAQRVTWAVGAIAGAVLVVLTCLLCTRLLF